MMNTDALVGNVSRWHVHPARFCIALIDGDPCFPLSKNLHLTIPKVASSLPSTRFGARRPVRHVGPQVQFVGR